MNSQVMVDREVLAEYLSGQGDDWVEAGHKLRELLATPAPIPDAGEVVEVLLAALKTAAKEMWNSEANMDNEAANIEVVLADWARGNVSAMQASAMVVPDGWRLVPVEMSDEMHAAYLDQYGRGLGIYWIYKAMLAAAPAPGGGQ